MLQRSNASGGSILNDMLLPLVLLIWTSSKSVTLIPKESVWVYENASSPADGSYLRAWGSEGKSCPSEGEDPGQFSYSYLKWDVAEVPKDAKLVSAKLEFYNVPDPGYSAEAAKKSPLEARSIVGEFDAKTWTFDMATKVRPTPAATGVFGNGYPKEIGAGAPVAITIDLMVGPNLFGKALRTAQDSAAHTLSLSLTAALDPSVDGRTSVYKLYGPADSHENLRPRLVLTFE